MQGDNRLAGEIIMIIQKSNTQYFLTLPKKIIEGLGWEKGDNVIVRVTNNNKLLLEKDIPVKERKPDGTS
jgi:bifunctional DNA-binding transcriptional regulator/antitoxin component of YhaV-PrlF toxin-antitoxin module